jgi:hypothetical protein
VEELRLVALVIIRRKRKERFEGLRMVVCEREAPNIEIRTANQDC